MRIMMGVDMEGITGICHREQTIKSPDRPHLYAEGCELAVGDINAAVQGLVDAGVDDIIVWDNHYMGFNEPLPKLHPAARYVRGSGANRLRWPALDSSVDGLILLGYHAMAGTAHAVLEHTMSSESWFRLAVNGRPIGEMAWDAALAGVAGVPVIMTSGDDKACAESHAFFGPHVVAVCVKQGLARQGAVCLSPAKSAELLRAGAVEAVKRIGKVKPFAFAKPAVIELTFKHTAHADDADLRAFAGRRIDGYTVQWTARDFAAWAGFTCKNPPPFGAK